MRVGVLGGGPAGLYAALLLARRGFEVTVFEREARPGGLAAGLLVDGIRVDHGSHRLHPSIEPDILADLRSLLGDELQIRARNGRIRLAGRWISFPLKPAEIFARLPRSVAGRLIAGALAAMVRPARDTSFADVVVTGLGRPMGELFYFPYATKIWGVDPSGLSGEQARRRISADSPLKLARKLFGRSGGKSFYYPEGGFGAIPEAIARAAVEAGATLRLGASVQGLQPTEGRWRIDGGEGFSEVDLILSTLPMAVMARMLNPPPEVVRACDELRSRAMVLAYITVPVERWTRYDAHYFPGAGVPFTRISEPKNYRDSAADPVDRTVICVEIPCAVADDVWSMPDDELAGVIRRSVTKEGLDDPGDRIDVRRLRHAYPIYHVGVESRLETVHQWIATHDHLLTFGRQGLFAHDNTHHALAMAREAVAALTDSGEIDVEQWERAKDRFASHVVED